jgi:hypothetical protein
LTTNNHFHGCAGIGAVTFDGWLNSHHHAATNYLSGPLWGSEFPSNIIIETVNTDVL